MIGIAGVGGIGSNVAVNLVRSGITKLKIVDFDKIDISNLNRQFYFENQIGKNKVEALKENLLKINNRLEIITINKKIVNENIEEIFNDCNIIVEGFDSKYYKAMLVEKFIDNKDLIVSASGIADNDVENIKVKKIQNSCYIVGDLEKDVENYKTFSTKVNIVAAIMANIILEKGDFYEKNL
ncbi:sulfur carrier protein ThiS adenylyltransferase ThiF [Haliovirga abyssi]|uniref:Thiamine biosynthesis protein ThiF n=1 Tax=Haliovirga abyssi TaxID=2996794 RepID=A0AAU9E4V0_9FUSO|nr:sulfur carrier protein ThiS adenylyltransferase ThiF [Haliovirga abyssi]BDU51555.1 thiamine biosynthesis protein ThiF [Haliovirga abyssi]